MHQHLADLRLAVRAAHPQHLGGQLRESPAVLDFLLQAMIEHAIDLVRFQQSRSDRCRTQRRQLVMHELVQLREQTEIHCRGRIHPTVPAQFLSHFRHQSKRRRTGVLRDDRLEPREHAMHLVKLRVFALGHPFERAVQPDDPLRLDEHPAQSPRDVVHAPEFLEQHSA